MLAGNVTFKYMVVKIGRKFHFMGARTGTVSRVSFTTKEACIAYVKGLCEAANMGSKRMAGRIQPRVEKKPVGFLKKVRK